MAVADVLPSENCLTQPHTFRCDAPHVTPNPTRRRQRRNPPKIESKGRKQVTRNMPDPSINRISSVAKNLVSGQVTILKRGDPLPVNEKKIDQRPESTIRVGCIARSGGGFHKDDEDLALCSAGRLGPEPETMQKQILGSDFYAGLTSPDPSSLPFPAILPKKEKLDLETSNLLRLLRLDL